MHTLLLLNETMNQNTPKQVSLYTCTAGVAIKKGGTLFHLILLVSHTIWGTVHRLFRQTGSESFPSRCIVEDV